jgi:hypothetical protein
MSISQLLASEAARRALKALLAAIRKDRANRYRLNAP